MESDYKSDEIKSLCVACFIMKHKILATEVVNGKYLCKSCAEIERKLMKDDN